MSKDYVPQHFYLPTEIGNGLAYSQLPIGALSIERLLANHLKIWQTENAPDLTYKKKTIVIANQFLSDKTRTEQFLNYVKLLIIQEFSCYVASDNTFYPIKTIQDLKKVPLSSKSFSSRSLKQQLAEQYNLEFDEIHYLTFADLDDSSEYSFEQILSPTTLHNPQMDPEAVLGITNNNELHDPKIDDFLRTKSLSHLMIFWNGSPYQNLLERVTSLSTQGKIQLCISHINGPQDIDLLEGIMPYISLLLINHSDPAILLRLVPKALALENLEIKLIDCEKLLWINVPGPFIGPQNLKRLKIDKVFSPYFLELIIKNASQLKEIHWTLDPEPDCYDDENEIFNENTALLSDINTLVDQSFLQAPHLSELESCAPPPINSICKFLLARSKPIALSIDSSCFSKLEQYCDSDFFNRLQFLNIFSLAENTNIKENLKKCLNLSTLKLQGAPNEGSAINLAKLRHFTYQGVYKDHPCKISHILPLSSKLQLITLESCVFLDSTTQKIPAYPELSEFYVKDSNIQDRNIYNLINNSPNLYSLEIDNRNKEESSAFANLKHNFAKLEELTLRNDDFFFLINKFTSLPLLKTLHLKGAIDFSIENEEIYLPELRSFYCEGSHLPPHFLSNLKSICPNIQLIVSENISSWLKLIEHLPLNLYPLITISKDKIKYFYGFEEIIVKHLTPTKLEKFNTTLQNLILELLKNKKGGGEKKFNLPRNRTNFFIQPGATLKYREIFFDNSGPLIVDNYRLDIFTRVEISQTESVFFKTADDTEIMPLESFNWLSQDAFLHYEIEPEHYRGDIFIDLTEKWQIIPSYAIDDKLIALYSDVDNQKLEIGWCDKSSSYFIRSREPISLNLHVFYKKISPPEYSRNASQTEEKILKLIEYFRSFPQPLMDKPVSLGVSENATDVKKFHAIYRQKIGSCEHRARAFHFFCAFYPLFKNIQVRLVLNDVHAFVEINFKEGWEKFDLGGYPANITPVNLPFFLKRKLENKPLNKTPDNYSNKIKTTLEKSSAITDYLINNPAKHFPLLPLDNLAALLYNWKGKNVLINCGINEKNSFLEQIFGVQPSNKESILYIAHPEELFIPEHDLVWDRETNKAQSKPKHEPANPLGKLIYSKDELPILVIDFNAFLVEEIVKWNSLIERDAARFIEQYQLPEYCTVIGLYDLTAPEAYDGPDFIERFHHKFNYKAPVLEKNTAPVSLDKPVVINCYGQFDLNILLGNWEFQEEGLMFRRGELIQGLLAGKSHFELRNIPNYEPFTRLLTQMRLTKKIHLFGNTIQLPDNLNISFSTGYQWDWLLKDTLWSSGLVQDPDIQVVNPSTFSNLRFQYTYNKSTQKLIRKPGYLEENKEKEIALYITRKLALSQWATLLTYAKHFSIKLRLTLAPNVSLPLEINPEITQLSNKVTERGPIAMLFITNNVQRAVNEFPRPFDKIIDVSEQPLENLWQRLTPLTSNKENFTFEVLEGVVLKGLLNGEKIALKGDFKPEFIDLLAELLVKQNYITLWGQKQPCTGRLVLFTTPNPHFNFGYSSVKQYSSAPKFEDSPMAMPTYKEEGLGKQVDVLAERFKLIEKALENFPYVIIKGHTATGKSTFITDYFAKKYKVYFDEEKWAKDKTTDGLKFLFKDEFNLETGHGLRFTDLFNNKPSITLVEYQELTPYHKIIFAVNPNNNNNNYSNRITPLLWKRYGFNSIIFDPLPSYFLRQSILLPLLSCFPRGIQFNNSTIFLEIGNFINKNFTTNQILITARELKTMALWLVAYKNKKPLHNLVQPAHYIGYHIAKQVLQPKHFAIFDQWFCKKFKVSLHSLLYHHPFIDNSELLLKTNTYFSSPSHHLAWKMLLDCLAVNELRCAGSLAQVFILEGPSGAGKSTFVQAILQKLGIEFTFIRASTSFSKKESLLIDAFINGKKVILDEMNTCIWPKRLIFELLGGTYNGQLPDKPGFMLIANQNSHALPGRTLLDNALRRRSTTTIFSAPTFWQQYSIVKQKHPSLFFNSASALIEKAKGNLRKLEPDEIGSEVCGLDENKAATRIATAWRSRKTKVSFIKKRHLPEEEEQSHPSKKMKLD